MEAPIYNSEGKKSGSVTLPEHVFGVPWNNALMHQVITSMQSNARPRVAHTKHRGDVRGGGRKPWRQKGTGRARHGSIRSPIWRGGGVTHGPRVEKVYVRRIPKAVRAKALSMALSQKFKDGEIMFVDSFGISEPKTSAAKKALVALSKVSGFEKVSRKPKNAALIMLTNKSAATEKSFRNISNVQTVDVRNLNSLSILSHMYLIVENPQKSVEIISSRLPSNLTPNT